jgi:uncharacterized membrane protein
MLTNDFMLSLSFFFHLIATVAWIGGLVTLAVIVQPILNHSVTEVKEQARLLEAIQKRFQPIANLSLIVLILTGMVQTVNSPFYKGFLRFDNVWTEAILFKHLAIVGMVIVAGVMTFSIQPAVKRTTLLLANDVADATAVVKLQKQQARLTQLNLGLSMLVLFFTALASAQTIR